MNWIRPNELYNKLNQSYGRTASLSRPHFMLILDVRSKLDFFSGHLPTAKRVIKNEYNIWQVTGGFSDVTEKEAIVLYDMSTMRSDTSVSSGPLIELSSHVWHLLKSSRNQSEIFLLDGGFEAFTEIYPNCKAYQTTYTIGELSKLVVLPLHIRLIGNDFGKLFFSPTEMLAADQVAHVLSDIDAHVNCSLIHDSAFRFSPEEKHLVHYCILENDQNIDEKTIFENLKEIYNVCLFIDAHLRDEGNVLVFGEPDNTTAIVVLVSYLMFHEFMDLEEALQRVCRCYPLAVIDETSRFCLEKFHHLLKTDTDFQSGVTFVSEGTVEDNVDSVEDPPLSLENFGEPVSIVSSLMKNFISEIEKGKNEKFQTFSEKNSTRIELEKSRSTRFEVTKLELKKLEEETQWKMLHHDRVTSEINETATKVFCRKKCKNFDQSNKKNSKNFFLWT